MLATSLSAALFGLQPQVVRVEVDIQRGVPNFELVGLAEAAVRESRVRVKSALAQVGVDLSERRLVVNLGPADVKKSGTGFDFAIAAGTLAALGMVPEGALEGRLFLGELSLSGDLYPARGVLAQLLGAKKAGANSAAIPKRNEEEAALVENLPVHAYRSLKEWLEAAQKQTERSFLVTPRRCLLSPSHEDDFADVRGQATARRAAEIAAAGSHNLLMVGPPGGGKTMIARRIPSILPPLSFEEALEVTAVRSVAGEIRGGGTLGERPFRAPHHTVSDVGLVGGGEHARPGEISLAHHGVLFLDELPEFRRTSLEALRQPMEDGEVTIARAAVRATYPSRFMLVSAMNPCPCGYLGGPRCQCAAERVRNYRARLSGPLLDRIDLHIVLPPLRVEELRGDACGEKSELIAARVRAARGLQRQRFERGETSSPTNARLAVSDLARTTRLSRSAEKLLARAVASLGLSARSHGRILRITRTIADLAGQAELRDEHLAEAIGYRLLDRNETGERKNPFGPLVDDASN